MVADGYKQTEVGVLPEEWSVDSIGNIASVSSGGTPSRGVQAYWGGEIPWITTTQINFNTITEADQFVTEKGLKSSPAKWYAPKTLLMAMYGQGKTRGKVAKLGMKASTNQACAAIVLKDKKQLDYIFYFLVSQYDEIRALSNTGNQENLNGILIQSIKVPLPPTDGEQQAIAEALSDVDGLIDGLEKLIAKKRDIKTATMQQLLTGKTRLPGFGDGKGYKQTELGEIPEDWEVRCLSGILAKTRLGGNYRNTDKESSRPLIKMGNIGRGKIVTDKLEYIPDEVETSDEDKLRNGDILFNTRNTLDLVGKVAIWKDEEENAFFNSNILRLDFAENVISSQIYANYALNTKQSIQQLKGFATGTTSVAAIYSRDLYKLMLIVPSKSEQHAIGSVLADMDKEEQSLWDRLDKTKAIKQGMMQELLTGKTRLL